jgi:hypothetical protein
MKEEIAQLQLAADRWNLKAVIFSHLCNHITSVKSPNVPPHIA